MIVYFDESGNTGANWLDNQQPYFVYGGWLMTNNKKQHAIQLLSEIFSSSRALELKSQKIWDKKKDEMILFINRMIYEVKAVPFFVIAEKKYMIAAKIVEIFFDPMYNSFANNYFTYPSEFKKMIADSLSQNEIIIKDFSNLIKYGTIDLEKMKLIKKEIEDHLKKESDSVAKVLENLSDDDLVKMIGEFEDITKNGTEKGWSSLIIPCLFERIKAVSYFCSKANEEKVSIFMDELFGFRDILAELNSMNYNSLDYIDIEIEILMCDSRNEPLIQAADLLSGFVSRSFLKITEVSSSVEINKLWKKLISIREDFLEDGIVVWESFASKNFYNLIAELAGVQNRQN